MIVIAEILLIGLLTPVARTFGVSDGTAGLMMTLPGIVAAGAAPVVTVTAGHGGDLLGGILLDASSVTPVVLCGGTAAILMVAVVRPRPPGRGHSRSIATVHARGAQGACTASL